MVMIPCFLPCSVLISCVLPDALPAALQSPGETASAKVVHSHVRPRKEEDHQGNDLHGVVTTTALLQLPALERPEDHLQEVDTPCTCCFPGLCLHVTFSPGMPACISAWP